ncbi:MAG: homocysteine S-methyltransferase family protein, partial [Spirochaetaceae bacterium]|nr:homocysteine S-methyltransferase family protein [Spirochaetaceae bacterium]
MGTMLYERGVFLNRCFDELVLSDAGLVESIHAEYVNAGVDVIETNTFGANRIRLAEHGLADRVKEIAVSAARLARGVAGDDLYVIGSVGPCLHTGQMLSDVHREEVRVAFAELAAALAEGSVDAIILETFSHLEELILAAEAAKETGLPVFALFTVDSEGETCYGQPIEEMVSALNACEAVDAIGMNCGTGPSHLY